jgi:hypothetical protein
MNILLWVAFLVAFGCYKLLGRTFKLGYRAMRRLHAASDGRFSHRCLAVARFVRPARTREIASGFLGPWQAAEIDRLVAALDRDGIALFDRALPEADCALLEAFARSTPALPMGARRKELYRTEQARALRYDFDEDDVLRSAPACNICFDGTLAAIAAAYFRCRPVYDYAAMWWTTSRGERDYSQAAQSFHWDMDRLFFLKFFLYLTDVTPETGPHVFVAGSHRSRPAALRPYRRYDDGEVAAHYPDEAVRSVCGRRGTVFAADTRALHKGQPIANGERLVLQVEFTISKFGQNYRNAEVSWQTLQQQGFVQPPDVRVFRNIRGTR